FGEDASKHMDLVYKGLSKTEILEKTGHTLGLKDINLDIKRGEIFVIMGLSGSGKSTLIRHFNRLIEPTAGQILFGGDDVMQYDKNQMQDFRRQRMSMVFQHFGLLPHQSVIDNVAFGLKTQGVAKAERLEKAKTWLADVGLEGYEALYPSQLSGGQQQRVGLARALCTDPDVLLMDEAFSALDPLIRSEMQDQLIHLQEKLHKTIVFITHDLDEALRVGDRIAILKDGELVQVGEPSQILLEPIDDYVEAFVRDVNRARALTVENVMKPPVNRITATTIGDALQQMRASSNDYAYVVSSDGYEGAVLQETLEQAVDNEAKESDPLTEEYFEQSCEISPESLLEEVIPDTLDTEHPLPVVSEEGKLKGVLSRARLAKILGR
ncbi:glycine betaine/L-proline ABC transporter ATP-binding protein, partial [Oleiphilus sp. HI0065]